MKYLRKIFILMIALLLVGSVFTACDKNSGNDDPIQERKEVVEDFVKAVMTYRGEWLVADNAYVASLDTPGNYVITLHWARAIAQVLENSSLQTGKIAKLNEFILSQSGKGILDAKTLGKDIFGLMRYVDFTTDDVKDLVYRATITLTLGAEGVYESALKQGAEVDFLVQKAEARQNLATAITRLNNEKSAVTGIADGLQTVIEGAEDGIKTMTGFVYNATRLLANDSIGDLIQRIAEGTLSGAGTDEIAVYIKSIENAIETLQEDLTDDKLSSVDEALGTFVEKTQTLVWSSNVLSGLTDFLRYAYIGAKQLPFVCDTLQRITAFATAQVDGKYQFIEDMRTAYADGYVPTDEKQANYNEQIFFARLALASVGIDYSQTDAATLNAQKESAKVLLVDLIREISAIGNYQTDVSLLYADMLFANKGAKADTIIGNVEYKRLQDIMSIDMLGMPNFKSVYATYVSGDKSVAQSLMLAADKLTAFCGENTTIQSERFSKEWYADIITKTREKLESEMNACIESVVADLIEYVDYLTNEGIVGLIEFANRTPVKIDQDYKKLEEQAKSAWNALIR